MKELSRAILVVLVGLVLSAELVGVGDEVVDAALLGCSFVCGEGFVVNGDEAAERAVGYLNDVFLPEVTAGAGRAFLGDEEVVWPRLSRSDFIGGHFFDEAGLLRPCGSGKQSEGEGDS